MDVTQKLQRQSEHSAEGEEGGGIFFLITSRGVAMNVVAFYCMAAGLVPAMGTDFQQIYNVLST